MTNNLSGNESLQSQTPSARTTARRKWIRRTLQWLGFPGGGLGLAATIHWFFQSGQPVLGVIACVASIGVLTIAIAAKFFSELLDKVLDRIDERLEQRSDSLADWIVAQLEEGFVGLWWQYTPQFRGKYYQSLIYACRTYTTQGLKTPGAVTPDLEKVFVPLRVNSRSLAQISPALIQQQESKGDLSIWDFLAESRRQEAYKRMAVIGAPGSGKTTLLRHITLTYAHHRHRQQNRQAPTLIPIFLQLHKIRDRITADNAPDLAMLTAEQVIDQPARRKLQPPSRWFEDRLLRGKCLVMLDGLDEVPDDTQRRQVSQWVDRQIRMFPKNVWILSSRPFGYQNAQLQEARTTLEVLSFSLQQMKQFLNRWYLQNEILKQARKPDPGVKADAARKANDLIGRIQNFPPLAAMALNPLLLTMIATVHDNRNALPGNRVELYDEICDVLLVRRQEAKGLSETVELKATQKQSVLQTLALDLMMRQTREFSLATGSEIIRDSLMAVAGSNVEPEVFLKHIQNVSGLLSEQEVDHYQFAHLSFQEYLAAAQVKETQKEDCLVNHLENSWWHETIRLYAANNDTTAIVKAALDNPSVTSLMIAYDCLDEGKSITPEVRQRLDAMASDTTNPQMAKLTAEVKLARRLTRLLRIDENTQIDQSYITRTEFQLFVNATRQTPLTKVAKLSNPGGPMITASIKQALLFCHWLNRWKKDESLAPDQERTGYSYYRLPTIAEAAQIEACEYVQLDCWTIGHQGPDAKGVRIVKAQISPRYRDLLEALAASNWKKADQETYQRLLELANRAPGSLLDQEAIQALPCRELAVLDRLWFHYSNGKFGFGTQASLWEALLFPTNQDKSLTNRFGRLKQNIQVKTLMDIPSGHRLPVDWHSEKLENQANNSQMMMDKVLDCALDRRLPSTSFKVLVVNRQGGIQQRIHRQANYFLENLARKTALTMMAIPGGTFMMGSPESESDRFEHEGPQHKVTVPSFWMSQFLITQAQWQAVAALPIVKCQLQQFPSHFKGDQLPVEQVSWEEAVEFCDRISQHTNRHYRLPTEAEWEYACRAGTKTAFYFGPTITKNLANHNSTRGHTTKVGQYPPNAFGLYDMHGNVWEWCQDDWHDSYEGAPTDGRVWLIGKEATKILRGGSWSDSPRYCRSAYRFNASPGNRYTGSVFV